MISNQSRPFNFVLLYMVASVAVALLGCHSNPYDGNADLLGPNPPAKVDKSPALAITVSPVQDVPEGETSTFNLGLVVGVGQPVYNIDFGVAASWAHYNPSSQNITCLPPHGSGINPTSSSEGREYPVTVTLSSSDAPSISTSQTFVIIVHSGPDSIQLTGLGSSVQVHEGTPFQATMNIQSLDFPNGPFTVSASGLLPGMEINPDTSSPTAFAVTFNPGFTTVTVANWSDYCYDQNGDPILCSKVTLSIGVTDPNGRSNFVPVTWTIWDSRQPPIVIAPTSVIANNSQVVVCDVHVEDPNGEIQPVVTVIPPTQGTATVTTTSTGTSPSGLPYTLSHVTWSGNPSSVKGTSSTLNIQSCVDDLYGVQNNCQTTPVSVQF